MPYADAAAKHEDRPGGRALQQIYERAFDVPHRGMKDIPRRLAWLAVLTGTSLTAGWAGPGLRYAGGPVLLAAVGLVLSTGFWWLTMRILLPRRIAGRDLIPSACATGVLYVAMEAVFSLVFSAMVISNEKKYGPIGMIFALLSYLIAIGVVVILGAVVGLVWQERSSGKTSASHLPLPKETAADLMTDSISAASHGRSRGPGCRAAGRHRQPHQRRDRTRLGCRNPPRGRRAGRDDLPVRAAQEQPVTAGGQHGGTRQYSRPTSVPVSSGRTTNPTVARHDQDPGGSRS